jgi:Uma2 family endonuclease
VLTAPTEMRLARSSREPDILFVARANRERLTDKHLDGPADLVIELVSDDSVARDRVEKFDEYQEAGVAEYWLFDPRPGKEWADFSRLSEAGTYEAVTPDAAGRIHSSALPGFWLDPAWFWQDPLPQARILLNTIAPDEFPSPRRDAATGEGAPEPRD